MKLKSSEPRIAVRTRPTREIVYPTSDGKPLGETETHVVWLYRLRELLGRHFAGQRWYVSGGILLFYQEGDPKKFLVPDVFAVADCEPGIRRNFLIWEEGAAPNFVLELTSPKTRRNDLGPKKNSYRRMGVREYFLYDVTAEYLDPILQGYRLTAANRYARIAPTAREPLTLHSEQLGLRFVLGADGWLNLYNAATGARVQTHAEQLTVTEQARQATQQQLTAAEQARQATQQQLTAAEQARQATQQQLTAAEQARQAAETEVARLRAELERLRGGSGS